MSSNQTKLDQLEMQQYENMRNQGDAVCVKHNRLLKQHKEGTLKAQNIADVELDRLEAKHAVQMSNESDDDATKYKRLEEKYEEN